MPQQKKDGKYINLKIRRDIYDKFVAYAEKKGQSKTVALERILEAYLAENDGKKSELE